MEWIAIPATTPASANNQEKRDKERTIENESCQANGGSPVARPIAGAPLQKDERKDNAHRQINPMVRDEFRNPNINARELRQGSGARALTYVLQLGNASHCSPEKSSLAANSQGVAST